MLGIKCEKTASTTAFSMSQHSGVKTKATKPRYKVLVGASIN